jgi:hypothetical protein
MAVVAKEVKPSPSSVQSGSVGELDPKHYVLASDTQVKFLRHPERCLPLRRNEPNAFRNHRGLSLYDFGFEVHASTRAEILNPVRLKGGAISSSIDATALLCPVRRFTAVSRCVSACITEAGA